jgi:hypothetical protein
MLLHVYRKKVTTLIDFMIYKLGWNSENGSHFLHQLTCNGGGKGRGPASYDRTIPASMLSTLSTQIDKEHAHNFLPILCLENLGQKTHWGRVGGSFKKQD